MIGQRKFYTLVANELKQTGLFRRSDCDVKFARTICKCYHRAVIKALSEGGVIIQNWGKYCLKSYIGRTIHNPKTEKIYRIENCARPDFKFSYWLVRKFKLYQDGDLLLEDFLMDCDLT